MLCVNAFFCYVDFYGSQCNEVKLKTFDPACVCLQMVSKCDICSICRRETFTYLHILCFLPPTISSSNITTISNICKFFQNHILTSRNIFSPFLHNLRCKHKMTDVRQKCNMYATMVFCASDGKIPIEKLCQRHRAPACVYTKILNIKYRCKFKYKYKYKYKYK